MRVTFYGGYNKDGNGFSTGGGSQGAVNAKNNAQYTQSRLEKGYTYIFAFDSENTTEATINYILTRGTAADSIIYNTVYTTTSQTAQTTPQTGTTASSSSSGSYDDDDDDDDDKGSSFSDGGTKTSGSGSSRADYKKSGKGAKYVMTGASEKTTTLKVPDTVKIGKKTYKVNSIAADAFVGLSQLKTATIGKNVAKIDPEAFSDCKKLSVLTLNTAKLKAKNIKECFKGAKIKTIYVPANKVNAYKKIFTKEITGNAASITVKARQKLADTKQKIGK